MQRIPGAGVSPAEGRDRKASFLVVGMGASAGGLEAFQSFFASMPADSGMAFVLVQHLDPRHGTLMPELLARHTQMPVRQASDKTPVRPNHAFIIPPNATLTIKDGVLRVNTLVRTVGVRTPIDSFFRSLAEDQRENAVCILLSGSGSDGTLGIRAVKEHGGMVMAQEVESAKHDSIPRSAIATGLVDFVLPANEMPARLIEYAAHVRELSVKEPDEILEEASDSIARICALLRRSTGHDFSQYKQTTLVRRIQRRQHVLQLPSIAAYSDRLRHDAKEVDQLFKDLLIGVTQFFRDPDPFEILAADVFPRILDRAGPEGPVRIWTPGCATGEEAYSLAILVREEMLRRGEKPRVQIFAGDIDNEALEVARLARYPEGIAEHVSPERLERFFMRQDHSFLVTKEIREMCIFSLHNLIKDPPFSRIDLIVCRNVLIYLEPGPQRHLARVFHYALRPGGYLFLGPSESIVGPPELFRTLNKKYRIYERNETIGPPPMLPIGIRAAGQIPAGPQPLPAQSSKDLGSVPVLERILVQHYSPAWVVINGNGEVVYFSPRTGRYLEPSPGAPSLDLVNMARKGLRLELRTAVHRAIKTNETVVREDVVVESNGEVQRINLVVRPVRELGEQSGFYMILFQELAPPRPIREAQAEGLGTPAGDPMIQQLEGELRTAKEHLQTTIEELEAANEELTSSNEELLSTNEELQSSNEELQTSKEELQSVNEELETINAELSKKIEELDAAHSDLQNLFESTRIATLFLDQELRIKRFTPTATDLFRLISSDLGRAIADIAPRFADPQLLEDVHMVLRSQTSRERQIRIADGSATFMVRILPYRRLNGTNDGVAVTFVDITELARAKGHRAELAAIVDSSQDAIVGRTFDGTITTWNASATRMFGFTGEEAIGSQISMIVPADLAAEVEAVYQRVRAGEAVAPFESVRLTKDGRRLAVSVTISAVKDAAGLVVGVAGIFRDLSDVMKTKDALVAEGRHKDEFMAMLSHELRNPLAPLAISMEVIQDPRADPAQVTRAKETMQRQIAHLTSLVDQLLDVSRISSGKINVVLKPLNLNELVRAIVGDYAGFVASRGLKLEARLPDQSLWVEGDPVRLAQALGNLVHNAGKFTDRGSIVVELGTASDNRAKVVVRDTGIGMEAVMLGRLFLPFSQADRGLDRSRGGLGLGLAVAKQLIQLHGGTIATRSDGPGHGSEFIVHLPLTAPGTTRPEKSGRRIVDETEPRRTRKILIIEDNADAAESLRMLLELDGHRVSVAADGPSGLQMAHGLKPDVVLCDVGLAGGMDGYGVAAAFRADSGLRDAQLVALTGYGHDQDSEHSLEAGFDLHIRKPADPVALRRWLATMPVRK